MGRVTTTTKRSVDVLAIAGIFSAFLLLTLTVLYLSAPVIRTNAADSAASASAYIEPVASLSVDPTVQLNITPSGTSGATDSKSFNVKVMTNASVGYVLKMAASGSSANMTSTTSMDVITSTFSGGKTLANLDTNTWGYSKDGTTFYKVPVTGSEVTLEDTSSSTANAWATHTYYVGAKVSSSTQSGTYSKDVVFTAIAHQRKRTFFDITYMHEMSADICANTPTAASYSIKTFANSLAEAQAGTGIAQTTLIDYRDMKSYLVRKYANGECWMAQNLEHDIFTSGDSVADGSSNTGVYATTSTGINTSGRANASATLGSNNINKWISYTDINNETAFTTTNGTSAYGSSKFYATQNFSGSSYGWADNGTDGARSYSTQAAGAANYITATGSTAGDGYNTFQESTTGQPYQRVGNYYNWAAAKAGYIGTVTGGDDSSSTSSTSEVPDNSICPRHWTLPKNGTHLGGVAKSFDNLIQKYYGTFNNGGSNTTLYNWLNAAPLDFWRAGLYDRSYGTVIGRTTYGYWWSRNASSSAHANRLGTAISGTSGYVNAQYSNYRGFGLSVRCVAR